MNKDVGKVYDKIMDVIYSNREKINNFQLVPLSFMVTQIAFIVCGNDEIEKWKEIECYARHITRESER